RLVAVARQTGRILQTGSQQRSDARFRLACELVRNGRLGKLKHIVTSLPAGPRRGPFGPGPVPPELDWDFWLGQTPFVQYVRERCHGSFRYWWEYSGGTMTDWGAPLCQRRSHAQFLRLHPLAKTAGLRRGNRPSLGLRLPSRRDFPAFEAQAALGPGQGTNRQRQGSGQMARARAARAVDV